MQESDCKYASTQFTWIKHILLNEEKHIVIGDHMSFNQIGKIFLDLSMQIQRKREKLIQE